jgi:hypothetical protein
VTPTVRVDPPAQVTDYAGTPNPARADAFAGTDDGVRPALVGGTLGETAGGVCADVPQSTNGGHPSCVRSRWSEAVQEPQDPSLITVSGVSMDTVLGPHGSSPFSDLTAAAFPQVDRDQGAEIGYSDGAAPVVDSAGNPALPAGQLAVAPACDDPYAESPDDDTPGPDNPALDPATAAQKKLCAYDQDWFRIVPTDTGTAALGVTPDTGVALSLELRSAPGGPVIDSAGPGQPGEVVRIDHLLTAGQTYYLGVSGPGATEGKYCADSAYAPGRPCTTDTSGGGGEN